MSGDLAAAWSSGQAPSFYTRSFHGGRRLHDESCDSGEFGDEMESLSVSMRCNVGCWMLDIWWHTVGKKEEVWSADKKREVFPRPAPLRASDDAPAWESSW